MEKQKLINEIKQAIQEELSIADEVKEETFKILPQIKNAIKETESKAESDIPGTKKKTGILNDELRGVNIKITYNYYNFLTPEDFESAKGKYSFSDSYSVKIGKKLWYVVIKCYGVSGSLDSQDLADSLQHEIEHIYQGILGKTALNEPDQIYLNVRDNLANKDNGIQKSAEILYFSYDFEQDAIVNGLYSYLREKESPIPTWNDILNSEAVVWIKKAEEDIAYLENEIGNEDLREKCLDLFGKTPKQIVMVGKVGLKRMKGKIGKVLIKVRKDMINEGAIFLIPKSGGETPYVL